MGVPVVCIVQASNAGRRDHLPQRHDSAGRARHGAAVGRDHRAEVLRAGMHAVDRRLRPERRWRSPCRRRAATPPPSSAPRKRRRRRRGKKPAKAPVCHAPKRVKTVAQGDRAGQPIRRRCPVCPTARPITFTRGGGRRGRPAPGQGAGPLHDPAPAPQEDEGQEQPGQARTRAGAWAR